MKQFILLSRALEILNQTANQSCKVANWLGVSKTQFIICKAINKRKSRNSEIQIDKQIIEQVNSTKFLELNFNRQRTILETTY